MGQAFEFPVHTSATSHIPAEDRQTVFFAIKVSVGQFAALPEQTSGESQVVPSLAMTAARQVTPVPLKTLAGQALLEPVQLSAISQTPALALQTVPEVMRRSVGQSAEVPVQLSATSHEVPSDAFTAALQTVVEAANLLVGQVLDVPEHTSCTSHAPADGLHTVLAAESTSGGHCTELPVQVSGASHVDPSAPKTLGLQTNVESWNILAGQALLDPVQDSATSHGPAEALQEVPELKKMSFGQSALAPVQLSETSQVVPSAAITPALQTLVEGAN